MLNNTVTNVPAFYLNVYNLLKNNIGCDEWGTCASAVKKVKQPEQLADEEFLMFIFSPQNDRIRDAFNTRYKRIELYTGLKSKLIELRYQVLNNVTETVVQEEYFVPSTPAEAMEYINSRLL